MFFAEIKLGLVRYNEAVYPRICVVPTVLVWVVRGTFLLLFSVMLTSKVALVRGKAQVYRCT